MEEAHAENLDRHNRQAHNECHLRKVLSRWRLFLVIGVILEQPFKMVDGTKTKVLIFTIKIPICAFSNLYDEDANTGRLSEMGGSHDA
jgi:hypothetical protein